MEVRFTVTLEDYIAFNLHSARKSGIGRAGYLFAWFWFPLVFASSAVWVWLLGHALLACGLVAVAIFVLAMFPAYHGATVARYTRAIVRRTGGRGIIGEHALIFSEETLVAINEVGRTVLRWENLTGVDVVGDRTFIWFCGLWRILPRAGFDRDEQYESARDFALRMWAEQGQQ